MFIILRKRIIYSTLFILWTITLIWQSFNLKSEIIVTNPIAQQRVIVIDPGHGGIDGGTNVSGLLEKDINLEIALKLKRYLEEHSNSKVIMTREEDIALDHSNNFSRSRHIRDLKARIDIINQTQVDIFISLHVDYRPQQKYARGPMLLYSKRHPQNKVLATTIQKHLDALEVSFPKHHPKKRTDLYVLKAKKTPGVIIEVGFLSNSQDRTRLQHDKYQKQLIRAIYRGIEEYFSGFKFILD